MKSIFSYRSSCKTRLGSKIASRGLLRQWPPRRRRSQVLNRLLGALWLASLLWKQMQLLVQVAPTRQDLGTCLDRVTSPQPLGPLAIEIQGVDLIPSLVLKMNKHELPSYNGSLANNTTKVLRSGSIIFGKNPRCQHTTNLSEFIPKQVPCFMFETRAKCQYFVARYKDDGIPYEINSPFCCAKTTITVRQSKSIEDWETAKQFAPSWRELADQLKSLFPDGDDEGAFVVPALDTRSHVLRPLQHCCRA